MALSPLSPTTTATVAGTVTSGGAWVSDYGPTGSYTAGSGTPLPPPIPSSGTTWTFELVTMAGEGIAELPAVGRQITLVRRGAGSARFTLPAELADLERYAGMTPGEVDLVVWRDGVKLLRGPLALGEGDLASGPVSFTALGLLSLLEDRFVAAGTELVALEQAQMAWKLVSDAQAFPYGDLGIVAGSLPDSVARNRTFTARTAVLSALEELAGAEGGFDFEVDPEGRFNVHYPRQGIDRTGEDGITYELGTNVLGGRLRRDAGPGRLANEVTAETAQQVSVTATDADSAIRYRLRQRTLQVGDVDDAVLMGDLARGELRRSAEVVPEVQLRLRPGAPGCSLAEVGLGDLVRVNVRRGWLRAEGGYRVDRIEATIPDVGGPEQLTLTLLAEDVA